MDGSLMCKDIILCLNLCTNQPILYSWTQTPTLTIKVRYLDTGCGEDVFHQVLVDPGISLQPLAADSNNLWPLQQAHLQLKHHGYLSKVTLGPTLEGIPK